MSFRYITVPRATWAAGEDPWCAFRGVDRPRDDEDRLAGDLLGDLLLLLLLLLLLPDLLDTRLRPLPLLTPLTLPPH